MKADPILAPSDPDSALHGQLSQLTMGLSPASLAAACTDWLAHLAVSPNKQSKLFCQAACNAVAATTGFGRNADEPVANADATDRRFAAPHWKQWPFDSFVANYQRNVAWWQDATTGNAGVSAHHEQLTAFFVQQLLQMASPSNFLATNPEALAATLASGGANLREGALHAWNDVSKRFGGAPATPAQVPPNRFRPGHEVAVTPGKVVLRNELIELIQYTPQTETVFAEPVLIVPPWIMKFYILDLTPHDSLVRFLVAQGHTVFMISWVNPEARGRDLGLDDYLRSGVMAAIDAVGRTVPGAGIQALGYCLGGTLLSIAAAALAREGDGRLKSLSLLATEVDFTEPGPLSVFIDDSQLAVLDDTMARQGFLDGAQMAGAFTMLNSRDLLWSHLVRRYLIGQDDPASALGAWNADATRMPYREHSEYLHALYRDNDLMAGRFRVGGKPVALPDIHVPIFALGMQHDTVVPWRSAFKLQLASRGELTFCLSSGGHNVGVVNPPLPAADDKVHRSYQIAIRAPGDNYTDPDTWRAAAPVHAGSWWPAWEAWLQRHAAPERVSPPTMGDAQAAQPVLGDAPGTYVLVA